MLSFNVAIYTACIDIRGLITCLTFLRFKIELRYELRIFVLRFHCSFHRFLIIIIPVETFVGFTQLVALRHHAIVIVKTGGPAECQPASNMYQHVSPQRTMPYSLCDPTGL